MFTKRAIPILLVLAILSPAPALPEERRENPQGGWRVTVGAGALFAPAFAGSREYGLSVYPDLRVRYKELFFASAREGIGFNLVDTGGWRGGLLAKYEFERKESGDSPFRVAGGGTTALAGMGDVDGTVEPGGFLEYRGEPFTFKAEFRRGLGSRGGTVGELSVHYGRAITGHGPPIILAVGPRVRFADAGYIDAYFGIDPEQAARTGLDRYDAGGGLYSYGLGGFLTMPIQGPVSIAAFAGYDRLGDKAADSPLVRQRGDANQFAAGLGASCKFDW
jgi:outer membrane scaffolding protein for murein synthesis (MipA/OmpV family)